MAKTRGMYGLGFSFKKETKTQKFAAMVGGEYMETTAVSEGQAKNALRARYNKKYHRQTGAYVEIEMCDVRVTV